MAGRKPIGPPLVRRLDGSEQAKERMEVILETVAGKITIREACDRLGIEEAMFFKLRTQVLQAGIARLEPRPAGRPARRLSPEGQRIAELEQELREQELQRKVLEAQLDIARIVPESAEERLKKTAKKKHRRRKRKKR